LQEDTMIQRRLVIFSLTLTAASAWQSARAQNVFWDNPGVGDYNTLTNWSTDIVPDAAFNEVAVVSNGGTAFLNAAAATPVAAVVLGQLANQSGTLEIRGGGSLISEIGSGGVGNPPDGRVIVGEAGTGTLRVLGGGTLNAAQLYSDGSAASLITVGEASGSPATVNVVGGMHLRRTTRVRRTAAITGDAIVLYPTSNYIVEVGAAGHSVPMINRTAQLDGRLTVELSGVTPTLGSTYNLFNVGGSIAGAFDVIQIAPAPVLPLGQKWAVNAVPAGGGRQFAQLKLDEFLVLNVNRGTGAVSISNPGAIAKTLDSYSVHSASGSLRPATWSSLDDQNAQGGNWGEANPTVNRLSELKQAGFTTLNAGAAQSLGIANSFNPVSFGTDTDDILFEYTNSAGALTQGIVNYVGDPNNLLLTVNPATGEAQLKNTSPFTVSIDHYSIHSLAGSLAVSGWSSLDDQNAAGGDWGEANPTANRLTELKQSGGATLAPGTAFNLGTLFATGAAQDLEFDFLFADESTLRTGVVAYGTIPPTEIPGDFDGNGQVNGADLAQWKGDFGVNGLSDANNDGDSDGADFLIWQRNLGTGVPVNAAATPVPEPASFALVVAIGVLWGSRRFAGQS
jgi:hypothetical protein